MSEHTHHHEPETSKYEQALKKYDLNLSDEAAERSRGENHRRKSAGKQHDGSQKIPDGQCGTDLIEHQRTAKKASSVSRNA